MARQFDEIDDHIDNSNPTIDQGSDGDDVTLLQWCDVATGEVNVGNSFNIGNDTGSRFANYIPYTDNVLYWDRVNTTTGRVSTAYGSFLDKYTCVVCINKQSATSEKAIWLDGVEKATSATVAASVTDISVLQIGTWPVSGAPYGGKMAEFVLWKTTLTDEQLVALANGVNPFFVTDVKPYFYYPLWGNNSPEEEYINGWNGTLVSAPTKIRHPGIELPENNM